VRSSPSPVCFENGCASWTLSLTGGPVVRDDTYHRAINLLVIPRCPTITHMTLVIICVKLSGYVKYGVQYQACKSVDAFPPVCTLVPEPPPVPEPGLAGEAGLAGSDGLPPGVNSN